MNFEFECGRDVAGIEFDAHFLKDARLIAFLDAVPFRGRLPEAYERVWVNGAPMAARRELRGAANQSARAGNGRQVIRFEAIVIPQRVGRILLPPTTVRAALPASAANSAPRAPELTKINSLVEGDLSGGGQRAFVLSASSSLLVHELPDHGRPANFTGLVGRHDVAAEVDRAAITFGDPLELTVSLSGQPYLAEAALHDLRNNTGFSADFEVRRAGEFATLENSSKVFRYALRPKRSGDLVIPAIAYSYFDPESGRYVSTHSAPQRIAVAENRVVTAADAEGPSMAILDPPGPGPAATNSAGPRSDATNDTPSSNDGKPGGPESALSLDSVAADAGAVDSAAVDSMTVASLLSGVVRTVRSPLVVGGLLAPPLVLLLIWLAVKAAKRRPRHAAAPPEPSPWEAFEKEFATQVRDDTGPDASAAALALFRKFVARHCDLAASSMTFGDLAPRLAAREVSPKVLTRVRDLFAAADAARYGAGSARPQITPTEIRSLAREIENELQRLPNQPR
ncbi:MAG: BatD family protein [Bryobacterales bacterium]